MEIVILLFLLSANGRTNDIKKTLNDFLCFYRENRELLQTLLSQTKSGGAPQEDEKNRPRKDETGSSDILSEFLKRSAV